MNMLSNIKKEFHTLGVQIMDASNGMRGFAHDTTYGDPEYVMVSSIPMEHMTAINRMFKLKWLIDEHEKTGEDLVMLALRYEEN